MYLPSDFTLFVIFYRLAVGSTVIILSKFGPDMGTEMALSYSFLDLGKLPMKASNILEIPNRVSQIGKPLKWTTTVQVTCPPRSDHYELLEVAGIISHKWSIPGVERVQCNQE